jgi:hypothetical protein
MEREELAIPPPWAQGVGRSNRPAPTNGINRELSASAPRYWRLSWILPPLRGFPPIANLVGRQRFALGIGEQSAIMLGRELNASVILEGGPRLSPRGRLKGGYQTIELQPAPSGNTGVCMTV